ncbi:MAG: hypothetical protein QOH91_4446 [Mycobacterium sp.]|nr:hypothetical protein [Mycobacterium sp.]
MTRIRDLDVGLVVAAAGTMVGWLFTGNDYAAETATVALNTVALMQLTHHYGGVMAERDGEHSSWFPR